MTVLENRDLVDLWLRGGPVYEVTVQLQPDPATPSGYRWSSQAGPPRPLSGGTLASADLVLGQQRPMALVLPGLGQ
jgi:HlyD family secretion protein